MGVIQRANQGYFASVRVVTTIDYALEQWPEALDDRPGVAGA